MEEDTKNKDEDGSGDEAELSIEDQIKKEMSEMKKPRAEQRFGAGCRPPRQTLLTDDSD